MTDHLAAPLEITTARLRLRKPRLEDAGPLFRAYTSDPDIGRLMTWRAHKAEDETRAFLQRCLDEWSSGAGYSYLIEIAEGPAGPFGNIHLHHKPHQAQFGYVIARPYWGQGYMTEALRDLVDWSLDQPTIWRASAFCDVENLASARVMAKAGLSFEGILRRFSVHPNISSEPRDCRMFAKART